MTRSFCFLPMPLNYTSVNRKIGYACLWLACCWAMTSCSPRQGASTRGETVSAPHTLQQIALREGDKKTFIETDHSKLTAVVFLSPECPLCKNYSLTLNQLKKKHGNEVRFYGVVPGKTYSQEEIRQFADEYKLSFPVLIDREKEYTNRVQATVTPEVVVFRQSGEVVYRGAIDDWVQALGKKKAQPEQHYLEEAIVRYLQKKEVVVKKTTPIGCLINEF